MAWVAATRMVRSPAAAPERTADEGVARAPKATFFKKCRQIFTRGTVTYAVKGLGGPSRWIAITGHTINPGGIWKPFHLGPRRSYQGSIMTKLDACPEARDLQRLALGELADVEADALGA